jgi:hypothetical protein
MGIIAQIKRLYKSALCAAIERVRSSPARVESLKTHRAALPADATCLELGGKATIADVANLVRDARMQVKPEFIRRCWAKTTVLEPPGKTLLLLSSSLILLSCFSNFFSLFSFPLSICMCVRESVFLCAADLVVFSRWKNSKKFSLVFQCLYFLL